MEPIPLKPEPEPGLPVPVGNVKPEACERAPTLVAGETAGMQGQVRVWHPTPWRSYRGMAWGAAIILLAICMMWAPSKGMQDYLSILGELIYGAGCIGYWIRRLSYARYLSADDTGIAIASPSGNRTFRWDEIITISCYGRLLSFTLPNGKCESIDLSAYPRKAQEEFIALLKRRVPARRLPWPQPNRH